MVEHLVPPDGAPPPRRGARRRPAPQARARSGGGLGAFMRGLAKLTFWSMAALALVAAAGFFWLSHLAAGMPETAWVAEQPRRPSVVIVDRHGREIARRGPFPARDVAVEELPDYLIAAVLAVEDRRFYQHHGVDLRGLARAALTNLRAGRVVQGGSTLTQQLAKNVFLDAERSLARKGREMLLAYWIERRYDKSEILEMYLNRVYFGAGAWGIEAAAQRYFGKSASDVTLGESALLAGLLKAPSRYSPVNDVARAEARATVVLNVMGATGAIDGDTLEAALAEPVRVRLGPTGGRGGYFADWAVAEARMRGGRTTHDIVVRTTLDLDVQAAAERAVVDGLASVTDRGAEEAALIALDGDGAIRAMVGGRSYTESQFNRAAQARRQPGSAFKPFVYAAAIEAGLSPWDVRADAPIELGDWSPTNYEDEYAGDIALINALARSINTVAVRVAEEIGRDRVVRLVKRLGMTSRIRPTRSMALGSHEVTPIEVTAAYAAFANGGYAVLPYGVMRVETVDGMLLWRRPEPSAVLALDQRTSRLMNLMLARVVTDGTGRAAALPDRPAAGKTGTTNDFRDAWFIGYVPGFVAGVWVGADDATPMERVTGGSLPARIWRSFMVEALEGAPPVALETEPDPAPLGDLMAAAAGTPSAGSAAREPLEEGGLDEAARGEFEALLSRLEGL